MASEEVEDKMKSYVYSDVDMQSMKSTSCGFYCLAWMMYLQKYKDKNLAYAKFLKLFSKDTRKNERILHQLLR